MVRLYLFAGGILQPLHDVSDEHLDVVEQLLPMSALNVSDVVQRTTTRRESESRPSEPPQPTRAQSQTRGLRTWHGAVCRVVS